MGSYARFLTQAVVDLSLLRQASIILFFSIFWRCKKKNAIC